MSVSSGVKGANLVPENILSVLPNYLISEFGLYLSYTPGTCNILYFEGANADLSTNGDAPDRFNDRGILLNPDQSGKLQVACNHACTTEPGRMATFTPAAARRGGVFRIQIGPQTAWRPGFHKNNPQHTALVQVAPVWGHRDWNKDMKRTKDPVLQGRGINHHGTRPGFIPTLVGMWSEGCMVRQNMEDHYEFMRYVHADPRLRDIQFKFTSTVVDTSHFQKWLQSNQNPAK